MENRKIFKLFLSFGILFGVLTSVVPIYAQGDEGINAILDSKAAKTNSLISDVYEPNLSLSGTFDKAGYLTGDRGSIALVATPSLEKSSFNISNGSVTLSDSTNSIIFNKPSWSVNKVFNFSGTSLLQPVSGSIFFTAEKEGNIKINAPLSYEVKSDTATDRTKENFFIVPVKSGELNIKVVDFNNEPLSAQPSINITEETVSGSTMILRKDGSTPTLDKNGVCNLKDLSTGEYTVTVVDASGYSGKLSQTATLQYTNNVQNLQFKLDRVWPKADLDISREFGKEVAPKIGEDFEIKYKVTPRDICVKAIYGDKANLDLLPSSIMVKNINYEETLPQGIIPVNPTRELGITIKDQIIKNSLTDSIQYHLVERGITPVYRAEPITFSLWARAVRVGNYTLQGTAGILNFTQADGITEKVNLQDFAVKVEPKAVKAKLNLTRVFGNNPTPKVREIFEMKYTIIPQDLLVASIYENPVDFSAIPKTYTVKGLKYEETLPQNLLAVNPTYDSTVQIEGNIVRGQVKDSIEYILDTTGVQPIYRAKPITYSLWASAAKDTTYSLCGERSVLEYTDIDGSRGRSNFNDLVVKVSEVSVKANLSFTKEQGANITPKNGELFELKYKITPLDLPVSSIYDKPVNFSLLPERYSVTDVSFQETLPQGVVAVNYDEDPTITIVGQDLQIAVNGAIEYTLQITGDTAIYKANTPSLSSSVWVSASKDGPHVMSRDNSVIKYTDIEGTIGKGNFNEVTVNTTTMPLQGNLIFSRVLGTNSTPKSGEEFEIKCTLIPQELTVNSIYKKIVNLNALPQKYTVTNINYEGTLPQGLIPLNLKNDNAMNINGQNVKYNVNGRIEYKLDSSGSRHTPVYVGSPITFSIWVRGTEQGLYMLTEGDSVIYYTDLTGTVQKTTFPSFSVTVNPAAQK